jgi:hypothetical protein
MAKEEEQDGPEEWAVDSEDPAPRKDGARGPPDDWDFPSWFSRAELDWYWDGKPDPCPVTPLGSVLGEYIFITRFGEIRRFTSGQLHGSGGLADLFGGALWWPLKHFRKWSVDKRALTGKLQRDRCVAALMRICLIVGLYDGSRPARGVGTWRGPDGRPVVHAGDRIFANGAIEQPGVRFGDALFVVGSPRQAPAHVLDEDGFVEWQPAGPDVGRIVAAHLDEWTWESPEDRDLWQGSLHCDMLCAALDWLPHIFAQAPFGSGKSSLLRYSRTLVGGAAHPVQRTYTKAYIEQHFTGTAQALFLDEMESDSEGARINRLFELIRLMSDDGAEGGRGSSAGKSRKLDVHGTVTMAATVTEEWRPQDRSRITLVSVRPFNTRSKDHPPAPPETMAAQLHAAAEMSPALRARAIARWELFQQNLRTARAAILALGGQPRDADQLGHLIAGWATMTSDTPLDPEKHEELTRFRPFVMSLIEEEEGDDEPSNCLNTIFGLAPDKWVGGERVTIGQIIALARRDDGSSWRRTLLPYGLMLQRREGEAWAEGWLAVANRHPGLDELLAKYPAYQGKKRRQILGELRRMIGGQEWKAQKSERPARIGGSQTRYLLIPPAFLPSHDDEAT